MANHCIIPLLGKRLRVTPADSCGVIAPDAEYVATDGFVSITLSSEVEDGAEIIVRKASGALCVNEKRANSFKRFTVELHFCGVNPALLGLTTNAKPYIDGYSSDVIGYTVPEGEINKWFSLELWTGLSGGVCAPGAEEASGYILLPLVTAGVLGDIEITGEDAIDFSMTGAYTKGGNQWGTGPFDVQLDDSGDPARLDPGVDAFDHLLMIDTALAPPPDSCDPQPINGPAAPTFATIAPATGPAAGGTATVITGTGLTGATGVTFGGVAGTAFSVVNATTVNVTAPAHAAGAVPVVVQHPSGNVTKANGYTYS